MISIIICSINPDNFKAVSQNIRDTIGIPHELIYYDNRSQKNGIASVYNEVAKKSKYDYLCFIHEDLFMNTYDWGTKLLNCLNQSNVGLVGLSGSVYKSCIPSTWSACHASLYAVSHGKSIDVNKSYNEVVVVDGCFLAITKNNFKKYQFDNNLSGFHGYDIDISLNVGQNKRVVVLSGIEFIHLSKGVLNTDWLNSSIYIHKKWANILPKTCRQIEKNIIALSDYISAQCVFNVVYDLKYGKKILLHYYVKFITKYFIFNKMKYTKKLIKGLLH